MAAGHGHEARAPYEPGTQLSTSRSSGSIRPSRRTPCVLLLEARPQPLEATAAWCARGDARARSRRREARAAIADARLQELRADPVVEAHAPRDLAHVRAELLGHVRDLVDEADLRGEEGVRGELHHLGARHVGAHHHAAERRVERLDAVREVLGAAVGADHHAVGVHEVVDRAPLLQELGRGHVAEALAARARSSGRCPPARCSSSRARGPSTSPELGDHGLHAREVGVAGVGRRRVHAAEQQLRVRHRLGHVGREVQALGVLHDQLGRGRARGSAPRRGASDSTFSGTMSRAQTSCPSSAKQAAVTRPTQPTPMTPIGSLSGIERERLVEAAA